MPYTFHQLRRMTFLTFREACDVLPEDAQKWVAGAYMPLKNEGELEGLQPAFRLKGLQPYATWDDSPDVPAPVRPSWLLQGATLHDPERLYHASLVYLLHGNKWLRLYFDRERVKAFKAEWVPMPDLARIPLPWDPRIGRFEKEPNKGGRPPGAEWHDLIAGAKDIREAVACLPELPEGADRFREDKDGKPMVRLGPKESVTRKHFQKVLARLNPKPK